MAACSFFYMSQSLRLCGSSIAFPRAINAKCLSHFEPAHAAWGTRIRNLTHSHAYCTPTALSESTNEPDHLDPRIPVPTPPTPQQARERAKAYARERNKYREGVSLLRKKYKLEIAQVEADKEAFAKRRDELRAQKQAIKDEERAKIKALNVAKHEKMVEELKEAKERRIANAVERTRRLQEDRTVADAHKQTTVATRAEQWIDNEEELEDAITRAMENPVPLGTT